MNKMKEILEKVYNVPELRKSIVPLFIGNPGLGKTVIIEEFAKEKGVNIVEFITSQRNPFEISGMAMPDRDAKKMAIWDFDGMLNMKDGDILFFDEILNGNPSVLNACLTLIEQRVMISGKKLPDIMIVAAANPQGMVPITPQIKERFVWYRVTYQASMWKEYMRVKFNMPPEICAGLSLLIQVEDFKGDNNYHTPRSVVKAVNLAIHDVPSPYKASVEIELSKLVMNILPEPVTLEEGTTMEPNELVPYLSLLKLNTNGNTTK